MPGSRRARGRPGEPVERDYERHPVVFQPVDRAPPGILADMGCAVGICSALRAAEACQDSWIAACCLAHGFPLATLNVKDFEDFAAYEGLHLIAT